MTPEAYKQRKDCQANPSGPGCQQGQRGGGGGGRGGAAAAPVIDAKNPIWIAIQGAPAGQRGGGGADGGGGGGAVRGGAAGANTPPAVDNGINGDPHMSSKELGKVVVDITVNNAVAEINKYRASWK